MRWTVRIMATGKRQGGFTYIGLLLLIGVMGVFLAGTGILYRTQAQREKEKELLFVGDQFRRAIKLYYEKSPAGARRYPKTLDDLLLDDRYPGVQRYLRKIYVDPMTGSNVWGLVTAPGGGILGVHSQSTDMPIKTANFPSDYEDLAGKTQYADWIFTYVPPSPPGQAKQNTQQVQSQGKSQ